MQPQNLGLRQQFPTLTLISHHDGFISARLDKCKKHWLECELQLDADCFTLMKITDQ